MKQIGASRICPHCGTRNAASEQFCANCGFSLDTTGNTHTVAGNIASHTHVSAPTNAGAQRATGQLAAGTLVFQRYRVIGQVGQGGFGAVYEAVDEHFKNRYTVALKEMSDAHLSPAEKANALQDFHHEANLLRGLRHAHLPLVTDIFEEAGKAYLVMEFVQGQTLEKLQENAGGGPLAEAQVMNWALQLCDVLHYLHTQPQPIIFRDLKPSNIMVTAQDEIKLIDFGIARIFKSSAGKDTTSLGSVGFAPPEQYGGSTDPRSDLYALGATLYQLLTGETPPASISRLVNPQNLTPPSLLNPDLSVASESVILKAMGVRPEDRYQSAQEMAAAITQTSPQAFTASGRSLGGNIQPAFSPLGQQQQQIPQQAPKPAKPTRRSVLALGAVAGLALLGGAGYVAYSQNVAVPTLELEVVYSSEKAAWFEAVIEVFQQGNAARYQGKKISIKPYTSGSLDLAHRIASGEQRPLAWCPASTLEINRLNTQWQQQHQGHDLVVMNEIMPLVQSPLVFAVWDERAQALLKHYQRIDWETIADALGKANGWADIGGPSNWGAFRLGQTRPDTSNSGLLTITLMAYAYYKRSAGLSVADIENAGFQNYLKLFENSVTEYGRSSGTYLENVVLLRGAASFDLIFTYENLVLWAQAQGKKGLRPFYPQLNIVSDHPFALMQGSWSSDELLGAARVFRQFLLSEQAQRLALHYGLRPVAQNLSIATNEPGSLFQSSTLKNDIHNDFRSVQLPGAPIVEELITTWTQSFSGAATSNG